jgi:hypothetical protein
MLISSIIFCNILLVTFFRTCWEKNQHFFLGARAGTGELPVPAASDGSGDGVGRPGDRAGRPAGEAAAVRRPSAAAMADGVPSSAAREMASPRRAASSGGQIPRLRVGRQHLRTVQVKVRPAAHGVKGWRRHGWASREGEERKEREVRLGLPAGSKGSSGLHESQHCKVG